MTWLQGRFQSLACALALVLVAAGEASSQGGHLCGNGPDEQTVPYWVLRFEILDRDSHTPLAGAAVTVRDDDGGSVQYTWRAGRDGIAVLIAGDRRCIPYSGTIEITAEDYRYATVNYRQSDFADSEDDRRLLLEGHIHQWVDLNALPTTAELFAKIAGRRYRVGVRDVPTEFGFTMPNQAPALFEYTIQLQRLPTRPSGAPERSRPAETRSDSGPLRSSELILGAVRLTVSPADLSGGPSHWQAAMTECAALRQDGHDDWDLPSREEISALYRERNTLVSRPRSFASRSGKTTCSRLVVRSYATTENAGAHDP